MDDRLLTFSEILGDAESLVNLAEHLSERLEQECVKHDSILQRIALRNSELAKMEKDRAWQEAQLNEEIALRQRQLEQQQLTMTIEEALAKARKVVLPKDTTKIRRRKAPEPVPPPQTPVPPPSPKIAPLRLPKDIHRLKELISKSEDQLFRLCKSEDEARELSGFSKHYGLEEQFLMDVECLTPASEEAAVPEDGGTLDSINAVIADIGRYEEEEEEPPVQQQAKGFLGQDFLLQLQQQFESSGLSRHVFMPLLEFLRHYGKLETAVASSSPWGGGNESLHLLLRTCFELTFALKAAPGLLQQVKSATEDALASNSVVALKDASRLLQLADAVLLKKGRALLSVFPS